ncbi:MAG TPA: hypothetical protein DEB57_01215 [Microbacterium sp.]|nr:hypothetical protein [Microbacterium sp.]
MSASSDETTPRASMSMGAWRVVLVLLGIKLLQWCVLALTLVVGPIQGIPEPSLGSHVLAGCWVGSSFLFVLWRRWLGVVSAATYSVLSLIVATAMLVEGVDLVWNTLTALGSAGILVTLLLSIVQRNYHHSRW